MQLNRQYPPAPVPVTNCEIYRAPRYGTIVATYRDVTAADVYARGNRLSYLKIHDVCQDSGDTAAVYAYGLGGSTTVTNYYDQITVENVAAHPSMQDYAPVGFFGDRDTNESCSNIWVANASGGQMRLYANGTLQTQANCSWASGFDPTLIEKSKIGVTAEFPY